MARKFEGSPILNAALPTQLITPQNVNSLVVDSARATTSAWPTTVLEFLTLWHVSASASVGTHAEAARGQGGILRRREA